jgi:hypothetical protein
MRDDARFDRGPKAAEHRRHCAEKLSSIRPACHPVERGIVQGIWQHICECVVTGKGRECGTATGTMARRAMGAYTKLSFALVPSTISRPDPDLGRAQSITGIQQITWRIYSNVLR